MLLSVQKHSAYETEQSVLICSTSVQCSIFLTKLNWKTSYVTHTVLIISLFRFSGHHLGQPGSQESIEISYKIEAFGHAYLVQSCSTAGEVISTALYCKHWSYSAGERSELMKPNIDQQARGVSLIAQFAPPQPPFLQLKLAMRKISVIYLT